MTCIPVVLIPLFVALVAECASAPPAPAGLPSDSFVTMTCAESKSLQVRCAKNDRAVRKRTHGGAAELEQQADGRFTGNGYTLDFKSSDSISLVQDGKNLGKACKTSA